MCRSAFGCMQHSGSCLCMQTFHLAGGGFGGGSGGHKNCSQKGSYTSRISATNQQGCVSSDQPVCPPAFLSVCLPACLSTGSWLSVQLLCLVSCKCVNVFIGEQPGRKRAALLFTFWMWDLWRGWEGREEIRERREDHVHWLSDSLKWGCFWVPLFCSYLAVSVAAAVLHKSTLTSLLLDFILTHTRTCWSVHSNKYMVL